MNEFPGFWRFVWMFWMQPFLLHEELTRFGVDPDDSGWALWKGGGASRQHARHCLLMLLGVLPLVLAGWWLAAAVGYAVDWPGVAVGVALGVAVGVAGGVAFGVALVLSVLAVPQLALALPLHLASLLRSRARLSPVFYFDRILVPLVGLRSMILATAAKDPDLARRVLAACVRSPVQTRLAKRTTAELQSREAATQLRSRNFAALEGLQGDWLPGPTATEPSWNATREAARYAHSAQAAWTGYQRLRHLQSAKSAVRALETQLDSSHLGQALRSTLPVWNQVLDDMEAEAKAQPGIPNPFVTSNPLTPDQPRMLFKGREAQIREIESILATSQASMALLAPRRCGKTSLLQMLPVMLPDTVCVFFDPQDNSLKSVQSFFRDLAMQARDQNRNDRRVHFPEVPNLPDAVEAGRAWFDAIEQAAGDHRVLIAIDEFERIEELLGGDRSEFLRLMGLFRATIQHRRKLRLLVAGVAPFDELGPVWDDHFINAREVRMGHLDEKDSVELLTKPVEEFPDDAIPRAVAEAIFARTGGQPYLLQMYGSVLVSHLDERKRTSATLHDVAPVEQKVLSQAKAYFSDTVNRAPADARAVLEAFARGERPVVPASARRWLERRCLITREGTLAVPAFGEWIRQEVLA